MKNLDALKLWKCYSSLGSDIESKYLKNTLDNIYANEWKQRENNDNDLNKPYPVKIYIKFDPWMVEHFKLKAQVVSYDDYRGESIDNLILMADEIVVEYSDNRAFYAKRGPTDEFNEYPSETDSVQVSQDQLTWFKLSAVNG